MQVQRMERRPLDGVTGVGMTRLTEGTTAERVRVDVAVLEAGASLPRHPAGREQVFYVLDGTGRVAGPDDAPASSTATSTRTRSAVVPSVSRVIPTPVTPSRGRRSIRCTCMASRYAECGRKPLLSLTAGAATPTT